MKFCYECGYELDGGEKHCPECGSNLEINTQNEQKDSTENTNTQEETKNKSIFDSTFLKIQKMGKEAKNQFENMNVEDADKNTESNNTSNPIDDIHDFISGTAQNKIGGYNYKKAKTHYEKGKYEKSIKYCNKFLKDNPENEEILIIKADCYLKLKEFDKSLGILTNLNFKSTNLKVKLLLGEAYREVSRYNDSILIFDEIIESDDECIGAYLGKAYTYKKLNNFKKSYENFNYALGIEELSQEDYNSYGEVLFALRKYDEAYDVFINLNSDQKLIETTLMKKVLNSNDTEFILESAKNEFNNYNYKMVIRYIKRYLKLDTENTFAWELLTKSYYYLAEYQIALDSCDNLLKLEKNDMNLCLKGEILIGLKKFKEAIKILQNAYRLKENNFLTYANIGFAYYFLNNPKKAKEYFDKSIEYKNNPRAWIGKSIAEDNFSDLYIDEALYYVDEDSVEYIAANTMNSLLIWNSLISFIKNPPEGIKERDFKDEISDFSKRTHKYFNNAHNSFIKIGISKDLWITNIFFEFIKNRFNDLATDNYYGKWPVGYLELKKTWIKTADILKVIYGDEVSYTILQGQIYNAFYDYKEAIDKYDEALELNKDPLMEYDLFGYKAQSYKLKKDYETSGYYFNRAILGYNKLLRKYTNDETIMMRKALNLAQIYKKGEAILVFEKILKINPNNEDAINGIKNIYNF